MTAAKRVGLLGGMFDPIHFGHLDLGAAAERALGLTEMLVLPSNIPPHRPQPFASSHHRFAMVALAIAGRPGWRAVDLELREAVPSYTADTLRRLHAIGYSPSNLFFVTGADAFLEIATWHEYPAVLDLAHFAVVGRSGTAVEALPANLPAIAARMRDLRVLASAKAAAVRRTSSEGASTGRRKADAVYEELSDAGDEGRFIFLIHAETANVSSTAIRRAREMHQAIDGMVPWSVQQHIEQHRLYEGPAPDSGSPEGLPGVRAGGLHGQD